ncbi:hypothetical protein NAEGRDRAFT_81199 [Naegleria gruberi]|uniref:Uncharacterized protein n=1 Tax=Naegleria gruberi TaxID=5762 RepID=D2VTV0_NAEGR|nr:uncharacterized protein NAEGRDRAFT_81199 [Naegleria gruberi]EFC39717.1 hypothetical protein NAEGRDRAFT_81199 [Naegleria gruberi]|eukprot:XP_002672461.1 hypothetical protein NAEGRDRAFT_81199 [Naegleria gruberi strain NEG-M]
MDSLMWSFSQEYNVKQQPSFKNFKTKVVKGGFQSDWKATPSNDSSPSSPPATGLVSNKKKNVKKQAKNVLINTTSSSFFPSSNVSSTFVFETKHSKKNTKQAMINANQLPLQIPKSNHHSTSFNNVQLTCSNAPPNSFQQFNMLVSTKVIPLVDYSPTNLSTLSSSSSLSNTVQSPVTEFDACSVQNSPKLSNETCFNNTIQKIEKSNKMKKHNRTAISIRELLN